MSKASREDFLSLRNCKNNFGKWIDSDIAFSNDFSPAVDLSEANFSTDFKSYNRRSGLEGYRDSSVAKSEKVNSERSFLDAIHCHAHLETLEAGP